MKIYVKKLNSNFLHGFYIISLKNLFNKELTNESVSIISHLMNQMTFNELLIKQALAYLKSIRHSSIIWIYKNQFTIGSFGH